MLILKQKIKKYFFWLAGLFLLNRLIAIAVIYFFPDILTIYTGAGTISTISPGPLVYVVEFITNLIIIYLLYKDMKQINQLSVPVLILTFFCAEAGVLLFLILFFAYEYPQTRLKHAKHS